ncbi:MAG TPA: D-alanyl-D-alanine carboxypeptidase family protein, partial [Clostridia bacterium]|nr:D-alanyl-D-alanine carboxypeptidase family protein [Clostridia bacterium]
DSVSTPYVCLMDAASGTVLYEKGAYEKAFPASTTKVMTCILALELASDINEVVTVGDSVETKGSVINILPGEKMPLIDLLYGMMLESGNDAARAIAEHFSGSESAFVQKMNEKAQSLGMTGTSFVKSNGLHKDDHFTTAYDMALLARYAMQNATFREIVSTETYDATPTNRDSDGYHWENTNKLIHTKEGETSYEYQYATGIKTGDTTNAGRCLVAAAKKDGVELVLVLFGDYQSEVSGDYRFENAAKFFEWGFANYSTLDASTLGLANTLQAAVEGASADDAEGGLLTLNIDFTGVNIVALKDTIEEIRQDPSLLTCTKALDKLAAPIEQGQKVGMVSYQYDGATMFTAPVYASRAVAAAGSGPASQPSTSPIAVETTPPGGAGEKNNSWVFWVCLAGALAILFVIARLIAVKRRRRRAPRRRKAYRARIVR